VNLLLQWIRDWAATALVVVLFISMAIKAARERNRKAFTTLAAVLGVVVIATVGFYVWRRGTVIAEAKFDPGIAPFTLTIRKVPVAVTDSSHFIVELRRGQYVVTSFRYFWPGYTPNRVRIDWPCINYFTVTFDDAHIAKCEWSWGKQAVWTMSEQPGVEEAGLSAYYFTPRKPPPAGCPSSP
jgi:hypothetical protein